MLITGNILDNYVKILEADVEDRITCINAGSFLQIFLKGPHYVERTSKRLLGNRTETFDGLDNQQLQGGDKMYLQLFDLQSPKGYAIQLIPNQSSLATIQTDSKHTPVICGGDNGCIDITISVNDGVTGLTRPLRIFDAIVQKVNEINIPSPQGK